MDETENRREEKKKEEEEKGWLEMKIEGKESERGNKKNEQIQCRKEDTTTNGCRLNY